MSRKEGLQAEFMKVGSLSDRRKPSTAQDEHSSHTIRMTREFLEAHMDQCFVNDVLYLVGKGFRCVENLDAFRWITSLCLDDNAVSSFAGLEELPCLRSLSLVNNRLTSLEGANRLKFLVSLDVSGNLITNIDHLRCLPHLTIFYISHNNLSASQDIFHLILCPYLECVDLSYNRLEGAAILKVVSCMDNLLVLCLEGNPVTSLPWYRNHVIASCRKLSFLDMETIPRLERCKVETWCDNTDGVLAGALGYRTPTKSLHAAKEENGVSGQLQVKKASSMHPLPRLPYSSINWGGARPKLRTPLRSIHEDSVARSIQGNFFYGKKSMKEPNQTRYTVDIATVVT
ncbi:dynein axonemal assembly factor 1 homolog [Oratosquilla oratoria]|uniref:dynein axonemal assembly factor 1 homolog n=1 Tax=Oratosquilla oratoria TaxID=337810 RepID=UPI003F766B7B